MQFDTGDEDESVNVPPVVVDALSIPVHLGDLKYENINAAGEVPYVLLGAL